MGRVANLARTTQVQQAKGTLKDTKGFLTDDVPDPRKVNELNRAVMETADVLEPGLRATLELLRNAGGALKAALKDEEFRQSCEGSYVDAAKKQKQYIKNEIQLLEKVVFNWHSIRSGLKRKKEFSKGKEGGRLFRFGKRAIRHSSISARHKRALQWFVEPFVKVPEEAEDSDEGEQE